MDAAFKLLSERKSALSFSPQAGRRCRQADEGRAPHVQNQAASSCSTSVVQNFTPVPIAPSLKS